VDGRCVMSSLQTALDDYLAVRRALGYKLLDKRRAETGFEKIGGIETEIFGVPTVYVIGAPTASSMPAIVR
jgi:hypothetical protein